MMINPDAPAHFRRQSARFSTVVESVSPDALGLPSPCEGWTVRDVVVHVIDTERDLLGRMPFGPSPLSVTAQPDTATHLVEAWHHVRNAMQAALDNPETAGHEYDGYFGPTTFAETVDTFYSGDLLVHGWDVARGAGLTDLEALDPDDMRRTKAMLEPLGDVLRSGGVYGAAVELSGNETEQQQFLAWTGRTA